MAVPAVDPLYPWSRAWQVAIREQYTSMPALNLTKPQVQRLWGLDEKSATVVLEALVDDDFLRLTPTGRYVRADRR